MLFFSPRLIHKFLGCLLCLVFVSNAVASLPLDLLNKKLTAAVEIRDAKHIKLLLEKGAEVDFSHIRSVLQGSFDSKILALLLDQLKLRYKPSVFYNDLVFYTNEKSKEELDRIFELFLQHEPTIKIDDGLLLAAARKGSLKTFERLQKRGASLVALKFAVKQDNKETCLLDEAIQGGSFILTKKFINAGFEPKGVCLNSLRSAVIKDDLALVKLLLANGASADGDINASLRPLTVAVLNANLSIVQVLLDNHASIYTDKNVDNNVDNVSNNKKNSLFRQAVVTGDVSILEELLKNTDNTPNFDDLLMQAAQSSHLDMLMFLHKEKHANIKQKVTRPNIERDQTDALIQQPTTTALHYAAENGYLDIVNYLLEQGLDPNAKEQNVRQKPAEITPLMKATFGGHYDVVASLIKHGADVDIQDNDGYTALYLAVAEQQKEILELLVNNHAAYAFESNVESSIDNSQNPDPDLSQDQPIHIAARSNAVSLLDYLYNVQWPTSSALPSPQVSTLAALSKSPPTFTQKKIRLYLDAKTAKGKTALIIASERGFNAFASNLIELGASINVTDKTGKTALHYASIKGNYRLVKLLLEKGAKADSADYDGNTSLHICALNHDIFRLLLSYQYQINTTNALGATPLMRVIDLHDGFYTTELLKRGANIRLRDNNRRTLLHKIALSNKEILLKYKEKQGGIFNVADTKEDQLALIATNNIAYRIEWLLQQGVDTNALDDENNTALHYLYRKNASSNLHTAISARLIKAKADINITNTFKETPIFLAGEDYQWDAVKQLLKVGANPNIANYKGQTILFLAVQSNNKEIAELLLSKGADVNLKDQNGRNPLFSLVDAGASTDIIEFLIKAGIDLTVKDSQGRNIIQALAQSKNKNDSLSRLDKILQQGLDINSTNNRLETALHQAVLSYSPKAVALLLKKGINFNAQDSDGATALHYAVRGHSFNMTKQLLKYKTNVNIANYFGKTPLHIAVEQGDISMVEILLESGANIHTQDKDLRTPLITAVALEDDELVTFLIAKGAYIDVQSKGGWRALHFAAVSGNKKIVKFLLEKGANPTAVIWRGDSVVQLLKNTPNPVEKDKIEPVLKLLEEATKNNDIASARYQMPLHLVVEEQDVNKIKQLLAENQNNLNADINKSDIYGRTVLEKAIISSYINTDLAKKSITLLLQAGADINLLNRHKESPLLLAVRENIKPEIIKLLLDKGAKPDLRDYLSNTPFLEASKQAKSEIIKLLIVAGAKIDQQNYNKQNAVQFVLSGSVEKTARRLLAVDQSWKTLSKEQQEKMLKKAHKQHDDIALFLFKALQTDFTKSKDTKRITNKHNNKISNILNTAMANNYNQLAMYLLKQFPLADTDILKWLNYSIANKNISTSSLLYQQMVSNQKQKKTLVQQGWQLIYAMVKAGDQFAPLLDHLLKIDAGLHLAQKDKANNIMANIIESEQLKIAQVVLDAVLDKDANREKHLAIFSPQKSMALLDSARLGKLSMVQLLLERGYGLENQNKKGETALFLASQYGRSAIVKLLLEKGAKANIQNKVAHTPLDVINLYSNRITKVGNISNGLFIARLLIKYEAHFDKAKLALSRALDSSDFELADYYIKHFKININQSIAPDKSFILFKLLKQLKRVSDYDKEKQQNGLALLNYLLSLKVDVNKLHPIHEQYPLDLVFSKPEILRILLEHGANAKSVDPRARSHIQKLITASGDVKPLAESLQILIAAQASLDQQDNQGNTVFHDLLKDSVYTNEGASKQKLFLNILLEQALKRGNESVLAVINKDHETPFSLALLNADNSKMQDTILTVISHFNQIKDQQGIQEHESPLLRVCRQPIYIKALLKQGVDVNSVDIKGESCLHHLLGKTVREDTGVNELTAMQLFIEKGIYINLPSKAGETPLFKLALSDYKFNYWEKGKDTLYKAKADLLLKQRPIFTLVRRGDGATPLHVVKNAKLLEKFIKQLETNILNNQDAYGNTPLHLATNKKLAELLLNKGANPNIRNNKGETPIFDAVRNRDNALINVLLVNKASLAVININGDSLLHLTNDLTLINKLIANGANVKLVNKQGVSPLHLSSNNAVAELLLKHGADINAQDHNAQTALHYAVIKKRQSMFDWLIAHHADTNLIDEFGETALFKTAYTNSLKMFKVLAAKSNSPLIINNKIGDNPLHIALATKSYQVADYLLGLIPNKSINTVNWESKTALAFAIEKSHFGFANLLEEFGANQPEWTDKLRIQRGNPFWLQRALRQNLPNVAKKLLVAKVGVSEKEITRRVMLREFGSNRTNLQIAAQLGESSLFSPLIQYGNYVDLLNNKSQTALMIAIKSNRIQATQKLLELGANPLVRDLTNNTILHMAVKSGNPEFLKIILQRNIKGLDLKTVNNTGQSVLQLATELRNLPMVTLLLNHQADPNTTDKQLMSPLLFAAKYADEEIIKLLIQNKANLKQRNKEGRTPLLSMLQENVEQYGRRFSPAAKEKRENKEDNHEENQKLIRILDLMLAHGADLEDAGKDKRSALLIAISNKDIVSALLKHGANIHVQDDEQNTPLLQSVKIKYSNNDPVAISRKLLKMGADIEHSNKWKESALHIAIRSHNFPAISLLIDSGAKLNVLNKGGYSPLHNIVQTRHLTSNEKIQLVKQLIKHKVALNKRNPIDNTALNIALLSDYDEIALSLINAGANVNLQNYSGNAAIHLLASRADYNGNDWNQKNRQLFLALKDHKANFKQKNQSGNSPLQLAINSKNNLLATLLLKEPGVISEMNQLNFKGESALHIAVAKQNQKIVGQLIKAGVNVNQKDNRGNTALHYASINQKIYGIVKKLIDAGAKADLKNYERKTPLDLAKKRGNKIAVKLMSGVIEAK